jgi:LmbE family N-acetylglucosaminyl deacetylase
MSDGARTLQLPATGAGHRGWTHVFADVPLLIVSPHLDDAALSCSTLLARSLPVDVLTVFAGAPDPPRRSFWDQACGFADSSEALAARRAEEAAAFAGSPHRVTSMDLLEGQYLEGRRRRGEALSIVERVEHWCATADEAIVVMPAGAGLRRLRGSGRFGRLRPVRGHVQHADHVFVRDALLRALRRRPRTTLLLYDELPYAFSRSADREVRRATRRTGFRPVLGEIPIDAHAKADRLKAYASQVPHVAGDGRRLDDPGSLPAVERFWLLAPPVSRRRSRRGMAR